MQSPALNEVDMDVDVESRTKNLVERIMQCRPRYIGIYAPGDFNVPTYRLVIPCHVHPAPGRGYHGMREMIALESPDRSDVDIWIAAIEALANTPEGPVAIRHILNPSSSKDEGLRLIWRKRMQGSDYDMKTNIESGSWEMRDWPRRDQMIREGKTVQAESLYLKSIHDLRPQIFIQPWLTPLPFGAISPVGTLSPLSPITPMTPMNFQNVCAPKSQPWDLDMEGLTPAE